MNHKLDTDNQVFFYEQDFYVLSNFSSFNLKFRPPYDNDYNDIVYPTSEHAYQAQKFIFPVEQVSKLIEVARSAHEAFKIAEKYKLYVREDWSDIKVTKMKSILYAKIEQHGYVRRKLLATGNRELVEDSWRDDYWGWGQNKDGTNMLGKLWMEIRTSLQEQNRQEHDYNIKMYGSKLS